MTRSAGHGYEKAEALIGGRYRVQRVLGIGGMACVYLTIDSADSKGARELAVKRLTVRTRDRAYAEAAALFVREFHTLIALRHPCVVEVYDYGVDELGPFYTMDHVEGGDLKERAPCDWREACSLAYDVCSVLALLHSRRLVHGDISPRNVRCTRDGRAKLIDFGALSSMGPCDKIIGTPAFVAPEVVSRLTSDARTDLYSLGATLYYALTGRLPYPASDFASLAEAWLTPPLPPSHVNASVPEALDAFVLALLAHDPVERPSTAYEVMARLSALAGLQPADEPELARAHLTTPALQGRQQPLAQLQAALSRMLDETHCCALLIVGAPGEGRSRMLDEAVALAKTTGAVVLRVGATRGAVFGVVEQLLESFPELASRLLSVWPILAPLRAAVAARVPVPLSATDELRAFRPALISALSEVMFDIATEQPLVVAADDVQRLDYASLSLLIALINGVSGVSEKRRRLTVLATAERDAHIEATRPGAANAARDPERPAYALLAAESEIIELTPLSAADTEQLLGSMFGEVPNLSLLSARVYKRAAGNARASFDLLSYLIAQGRIVYARGGWTLPSVLPESELPLSDVDAVNARVARLPRYGQLLLCCHALAPRVAFGRDDYTVLMASEQPSEERDLDQALTELLSQSWLRFDGRVFSAAHPAATTLALAAADSGELQRVHRGLAAYYARSAGATLLVGKHLFAAGQAALALRTLLDWLQDIESTEQLVAAAREHPGIAAEVLALALDTATRAARPAHEIVSLEQWLLMIAPVVDSAYYDKVGPSLRAKLERDSGLAAYRGFVAANAAASDALTRALTHASDAYGRASADEQGLPPEQAIEWLARYVAVSIALGSKTNDGALIASLPKLLEPFAQLSPVIDALWQNAVAVCELSLHCQHMQARERWRSVLERLPDTSSADLQYVQYMRRAIVYAIGMLEIRLGIEQGAEWTELDADPSQAVNVMYLRKCLRLQAADRKGAEHYRKQAELLHLRSTAEQMFASNLLLELSAHAFARDVQGVKQTWDRIVPMAARYAGWIATELLARGTFHQLVGEPQQALDAFAASLRAVDFERDAGMKVVLTWPAASAGYVETLSELGRVAEARAYGERALQLCQERKVDVAAHGIVRALALAEAKGGETDAAIARLLALLEQQRALGVKGIQLAASYEARAKVALCMQDNVNYREYARLGAAEYHEAHTSSLTTRYSGWLTKTRDAATGAGTATDPESCFNTVQLRGSSSARADRARQRTDVVTRERDPQEHDE